MHIVVVDGYTMNPGDLSWQGLEKLASCTFYDRTPAELVIPRVRNAEMVITNKVIFDREVIAQLPELRYIGISATGYNVVDLEAANERGIVVTNVPAYGTHSVAQMTFALLFALTNQVALHADSVRAGAWAKSKDFCYWQRSLTELHGLTMGIIGYGDIGKVVADLALAFGMRVLVATRTPREGRPHLDFVDLPELLQKSDVVSLHCPLTPETQDLINKQTLSLMKPSALLLNTSRGKLIVEAALAEALNTGKIAGAGLDVLSEEPPQANNPLLSATNCLITPHIGWATLAARQRLLDTVVANVAGFLTGAVQNCINNIQK